MDEFEELCLPSQLAKPQIETFKSDKVAKKAKIYPRHFIKGPIDLNWMLRASEIGSREVKVGLALWYFSGLNKGAMQFRTGIDDLTFGTTSGSSVRRAISCLCKAGLVKVTHKAGSKSTYEIVLPPHKESVATLTAQLSGRDTEGITTPQSNVCRAELSKVV